MADPSGLDDCSGTCCRVMNYQAYDYIYISNAVLSTALVMSLVYLVARLRRAYEMSLTQSQYVDSHGAGGNLIILPFYYFFSLLACFFFALQTMGLMILPEDRISTVFVKLLLSGQTFVFNAPLVYLFFPRANASATRWTVAIVGVVTVVTAVVYFLSMSNTCPYCSLFMPTRGLYWLDVAFTAVYALVTIVWSRWGRRHLRVLARLARPRPKMPEYALYLLAVALVQNGGAVLFRASGVDASYCVVGVSLLMTSAGFAPVLYRTATHDSRYCWTHDDMSEHYALMDTAGAALPRPQSPGTPQPGDPVMHIVRSPHITVVRLAELDIRGVIGEGAHGTVLRARWHGTDVAAKKMLGGHTLARSDAAVREFAHELTVLARLRHPNVLLFMAACVKPLLLVTEFAERGSLFDVLVREGAALAWAVRQRILTDVASACVYLHGQEPPILHRDLKSPNLLIMRDWTVKICDFGLSRTFSHTNTLTTMIGTPQWAAPELLRDERYSTAADVYSFGVVVWEVVTGRHPFAGVSPLRVINMVAQHFATPDIPEWTHPALADLMRRCWRRRAAERPAFPAILATLHALDAAEVAAHHRRERARLTKAHSAPLPE